MMKVHLRNILKSILFLCLLGGLFALLCFVFQPVWTDWNNYDTVHGFYLEPENTIETVFLGPSTVVDGIAPMELYEKHGYCAYNLATEQQPMLASYYWLKEAYRLHADSLKVVFLDPSSMRLRKDLSFYQKAIDGMRFSRVKTDAVAAYQHSLNDRIEHTVPLFEYHDRWDQFHESDNEKFRLEPVRATRGYHLEKTLFIDSEDDFQDLLLPRSWYDPREDAAELTDESLEYFEKLVSFCREKGLHLVILVPVRPNSWNSSLHRAVCELADAHDLPCYDFNASPLLEELSFVMGQDHMNPHLNYYGAIKMTDWIGRYLEERGLNTDISGAEGREFMEEQREAWDALIERSIEIRNIENIADYLTVAGRFEHCYVLISVRDEASNSLTKEQRKVFSGLGLEKLSDIGYRESYIGVMKDGVVEKELRGEKKKKSDGEDPWLAYAPDDRIRIPSGGLESGDRSSIVIDDNEYSPGKRGINIVIYDYEKDEICDSVVFDTFASPVTIRNADLQLQKALEEGLSIYQMDEGIRKLYLYNRKFRNQQYADYWRIHGDKASVFAYLDPFLKNPGYTVLISLKDEGALSLDPESRQAFAQLGLRELSNLATRECYIGILNDGAVHYEQRALGAEPLRYDEIDFSVVSGGFESGNISSILVHGEENSRNKRGLNIVVYDRQLETVVSRTAFDTHKKTPSTSLELSILNQEAEKPIYAEDAVPETEGMETEDLEPAGGET